MHIKSYEEFNAIGRTYHTDGRMLTGVWGCSGNNSNYRFVGIARPVDAQLLEKFLAVPGVYSVKLEETTVEVWIRESASWSKVHAELEKLISTLEPKPAPQPWR